LPVHNLEPALKLSSILKTTQLHVNYSLVSYKAAEFLSYVIWYRTQILQL